MDIELERVRTWPQELTGVRKPQCVEFALRPHNIIAYHCTRLTESEIRNIKQSGLEVLSANLFANKVKLANQEGFISEKQKAAILNNDWSREALENKHGSRTGKIDFIFTTSSLRDSNSFYPFFKYWGGESLYRAHEEDPEISKALEVIGIPCIIKCAIPYNTLIAANQDFLSSCQSIVEDQGELQHDYGGILQATIREKLGASSIRNFYKLGSDEFEALTNCSSWLHEHRPRICSNKN